MGILGFIEEKKTMFKNKIEANRTASVAKKEKALKELEIKNKVRENDLKIERDYEKAKAKETQLIKEARGNTFGGRVAKRIKDKYAQSKQENKAKLTTSQNPFTSGSLGSNPFSGNGNSPFNSGSLGKNVFSQNTVAKPVTQKKTVKIITYK